jgi:uncharacterized lipoprotein YmbA
MRACAIGLAGVLVGWLLWGCSILAPQSDPSRYYVLTPVAAVDAGGQARPLALGVGPVVLPEYLNRPEIVRRDGASKLVVSQTRLWGEPLEGNVPRVISEDLRRLLGAVEIVQYPWFATVTIDYEIRIDVQRFEADEHGTVSLDARWAIRRPGEKRFVRDAASRIAEPARDESTESVVAAMSEALGKLSREIAAGLP